MKSSRGRVLAAGFAILAVVVVLCGLVMVVGGFRAYRDLSNARDQLLKAREVVDNSPSQAQAELKQAQSDAQAAASRVDGPLWDLASAIPVIGATPRTAQAMTTAMDQAVSALQPLGEQVDVLNPSSLVQGGQINISGLQAAAPVVGEVQPGVQSAAEQLAATPSGRLVPPQLRAARDGLQEQLDTISSALSVVSELGDLAGPLLGQGEPKRYFVGVLNPNELRGTGGFLGTYAILTAADGKLTVSDVSNNNELPNLDALPAELGKEFKQRYSDDAILRGNMNISPHFPSTAAIWLAAWEKKSGEQLDGALALDVVALGEIVEASGKRIPLPDGGSLSGQELGEFAVRGIYEKFPTLDDDAARDAYQKQVSQSALQTLTSMPRPVAMAEALGHAIQDHRAVAWTRDSAVQDQLYDAGVAGSLVVPDGHHVQVVGINSSGSKLEAFLNEEVTYEVGRCTKDGKVTSQVAVSLRSDVPLGERPPPYMVGQARETPTGPVNFLALQVHLPNGATLRNVTLDGEPVPATPFTEQGRPAALVALELKPRQKRELTFEFKEPASDGPAEVVAQPLARDYPVRVVEVGC